MSVGDDVAMNILGGAVGGVLRALEAQEAQRTARELAVARENHKGGRLTDPPPNTSAMSQEEIDALLKSTLEDAGKPS